MTLEYVRRQYGVPVKRGMQITVDGRPARILSATHQLHVEFMDGQRPIRGYAHPMWHVDYPLPSSPDQPQGTACGGK